MYQIWYTFIKYICRFDYESSYKGGPMIEKAESKSDKAQLIGKRMIVDAHNDTMMKVVDPNTFAPKVDIGQPTVFHIDLPKMIEGNVSIAYFAAYTTDLGSFEKNNNMLLASMNALEFTELSNKANFCKARSFDAIEKALEINQRVGIQTIEGAYAFNEENLINLMQQYDDLGVKVIAPVWNYSNAIGEGTLEQYIDGTVSCGGLTELGQEFVGKMNQLGIIIDVSHMNERTFWDTIKFSQMPLIASHSGASTINKHIRNLTDDQIRALAEKDGVINVVFCRYFIGDEHAGVSELVDHIDHIVKVVGIRHVGLGSDFDGATMPVDLEDISQIYKIADMLEQRGYKEDEIQLILGKNNLRVLKIHDEKRLKQVPLEGEVLIDKRKESLLIQLKINEEAFKLVIQENLKVKGVFDGIEIPVNINFSTNRLDLMINESIVEPYHVLTVSFIDKSIMNEGVRYFCTRIVELR